MTSSIQADKLNVILNDARSAKAVSEYKFTRIRFENKWVKVIVTLYEKSIKYTINGDETVINEPLENIKTAKIYFGANKQDLFYRPVTR